jgi:hypothetical protein
MVLNFHEEEDKDNWETRMRKHLVLFLSHLKIIKRKTLQKQIMCAPTIQHLGEVLKVL